MQLFQKTETWLSKCLYRRILINCNDTFEGLSDWCFRPNQLNSFNLNTAFYVDIRRDASSSMFFGLDSGLESYILRPTSWKELNSSLQEIQDFRNSQKTNLPEEHSKTALIINDWTSLLYLFSKNKNLSDSNPNDFLFSLRFLNDELNIIILNKSPNGEEEKYYELQDWSQLSLSWKQNILCIEKSLLTEWKVGQKLNNSDLILSEKDLQNQGLQLSDSIMSINSMQSLNILRGSENIGNSILQNIENSTRSEIYQNLLLRLAESSSRQDLLIARREIQGASANLSKEEKLALSDVYKTHLYRIKNLEDSMLSSEIYD